MRRLLDFPIAAFCVVMLVNIGVRDARAQNSASTSGQNTPKCLAMRRGLDDPSHHVLDLANCQKKADDETSVKAVVTEAVFSVDTFHGQVPRELEAYVKARLAQAEIAHLKGKAPGVEEQSIVKLVNTMAKKFGLPDYAMTSQAQVRYLRVGLTTYQPEFLRAGMTRPDAKIEDSINTRMSPLQAVYLLSFLVDLKVMIVGFQVLIDQWDPQKPLRAVTHIAPNRHTDEIRRVLGKAFSAMSLTDAQQMIDQSFDILGIQ